MYCIPELNELVVEEGDMLALPTFQDILIHTNHKCSYDV